MMFCSYVVLHVYIIPICSYISPAIRNTNEIDALELINFVIDLQVNTSGIED